MTLPEFRRLVRKEFGGDLRQMTPANVREFVDRVSFSLDGDPPAPNRRIALREPEGTYEAIVRDFLRQSLELPSDQAVIRLWLYALELTVASVSDLEAEKFERLFAELVSD